MGKTAAKLGADMAGNAGIKGGAGGAGAADRRGARRRFIVIALALAASLALLEGVFFNWEALRTRGLSPVALPLTEAVLAGNAYIAPDGCVLPAAEGDAAPVTLTFDNIFLETQSVMADFDGDGGLTSVTFSLTDDATAYAFAPAYTALISPDGAENGRAYGRLISNGPLYALRITLNNDTGHDVTLRAVTLNAPKPYHFSAFRYMALLLPLLLLCAVLTLGWHRAALDRDNPYHRLIYALAACFCILLALAASWLCKPSDMGFFDSQTLAYPLDDAPLIAYRAHPHALQLDAWLKGQLHIDAAPDAALLALDNPYDPSERTEKGVSYFFDYALHEGKYFVYFGATPTLVYFLPFYLLTGAMPAYAPAALFFTVLSAIAAFLCVWELARRFCRRCSLALLCLFAAAAFLGSQALTALACADRYYACVSCMLAFFYLTVFAALRACRCKRRAARLGWFAATAVFTALLVESRVMGALAAAGWVAPLFIGILLDKKRSARAKAWDAAAFLAPLAVCAAAILWYNGARFGSVLEFGQFRQLTLEDIAYNSVRMDHLPKALYYFFFDRPDASPVFPYITLGAHYLNLTGNYFYGAASFGALAMPVTWGSLLVWDVGGKRRRKLAVYMSALAVCLPIAVLDFAIAGVAQRYVCDILPTLALVGALVLLEKCSEDVFNGRRALPFLGTLACVGTALVAVAGVFSNYRNFMQAVAPDKFLFFYRLFSVL